MKHDTISRNHIYAINPPRFHFGRKKSKFSVVLSKEQKIESSLLSRMVEISEVQEALGYEDQRSTINWCNKNSIATIRVGKKYFIHQWTFETFLLRSIRHEYRKMGEDGDSIVAAIQADDKVELCRLLGAPVTYNAANKFRAKKSLKKTVSIIDAYKSKIK